MSYAPDFTWTKKDEEEISDEQLYYEQCHSLKDLS